MTEDQKVLELEWQRLLYRIKPNFNNRKPNLQVILFLIGVQELGQLHRSFTKEEKQDLMHIAVCKLLSQEGYFQFQGMDEEGWPHYEPTRKEQPDGLDEQEVVLKRQIIRYFEEIEEDL